MASLRAQACAGCTATRQVLPGQLRHQCRSLERLYLHPVWMDLLQWARGEWGCLGMDNLHSSLDVKC